MWTKNKWETVVAVFAIGVTALMIMLRIKGQKENFKNAKDSHEAEKKVNKKAEKELVDGLTTISNDKEEALENLDTSTTKEEELLIEEKDEFAKDASESNELGKDLAKLIGAEFVETKKDE